MKFKNTKKYKKAKRYEKKNFMDLNLNKYFLDYLTRNSLI